MLSGGKVTCSVTASQFTYSKLQFPKLPQANSQKKHCIPVGVGVGVDGAGEGEGAEGATVHETPVLFGFPPLTIGVNPSLTQTSIS